MPTSACGVPAPIHTCVVAQLDVLEFVDPGDVDEVLEVRQPHREHRHQALSAGQDLGVLAVLAQHLHGLGDGVGAVVGECGCLHGRSRSAGDIELSSRARAACSSSARSAAGCARLRRPSRKPIAAPAATARDHRGEALGHRHRNNFQQIDRVARVGRGGGGRRRLPTAEAAVDGADPPSRSASRFLANWPIRLRRHVGQHATAELRGLAGDGEVGGDDTRGWRRPRPSAGR